MLDVGPMNTTLTLAQAVYVFKAVEEQAKDLLESTQHVTENLQTAQKLRRQKSQSLSPPEKRWVDGVLINTDKTLDNVRSLIEPARVDMQTNYGNVGFVGKARFVFKDSPKVQTQVARLTIASGSLDHVLAVLFSKEERPMNTLGPPAAADSPEERQRMSRIASRSTLSSFTGYSSPPAYLSPVLTETPRTSYMGSDGQRDSFRPQSRNITEAVLEMPDTSPYTQPATQSPRLSSGPSPLLGQASYARGESSEVQARGSRGPQRQSVSSVSDRPTSELEVRPGLGIQSASYGPPKIVSEEKIAVVNGDDGSRHEYAPNTILPQRLPSSVSDSYKVAYNPIPTLQRNQSASSAPEYIDPRSSVSSIAAASAIIAERHDRSMPRNSDSEASSRIGGGSRRKNWLAYQANR